MTNLPKMASRTRSLVLLRETWSWMSQVSGFDPFFSAIEKVPGLQIQNVFVLQSLPPLGVAKRLARRIRRPAPVPDSPSPFVEPRHEAAGSELLAAMSAAPEALALLSAGENQYGGILSHAAPAIRSRLIVCFHQPPSWWRLHWRDANLLDGLGGIVSLCEEQRNYFVSLTSTPVTLIRHGVSLDFFTPSDQRPDGPPRLLVVGHWLRDFDTLAASVELVWQSHPQVEVECVIPPIARERAAALLRLARDSKVRWHAGISAEKLRDLYRQATLLFLPLLDAMRAIIPLSKRWPAVFRSFRAKSAELPSMSPRIVERSVPPARPASMRKQWSGCCKPRTAWLNRGERAANTQSTNLIRRRARIVYAARFGVLLDVKRLGTAQRS